MTVSVDEHKIVVPIILMVSIYVVDFQCVLVSKVELAVAASALLLFEQFGSTRG